MTVVGRGREEEAVLEAGGARSGSGVVRLVEDEERAGLELAQPVAERRGVGLVAQERVRQDEAGVGGEGVDAESPGSATSQDEFAVKDGGMRSALRRGSSW